MVGRALAIFAVAVAAAGCGTTAVGPSSTTSPATTSSVPATVPTVVAPTTTAVATFVTAPPTTTADVPLQTTPPEPTRPAHLRPGARVVPVATYTRDVTLSLSALRSFSDTLGAIDSPGEFSARLTSLRTDLRTFDGLIRRLRSYQLANPELDRQRGRLALQGPPLARSMSSFLDAVRDGDVGGAKRLARDIQTRLARFRSSA